MRVPPALADRQRDAEVGHQGPAIVQQDVLRLDVAVDHAVAVGVVERPGDLGSDADRIADRELLLAVQPVPQRFALDERHHVVRGPVDFAGVDQAEDVGVLQVGDGLDLAEEPLGADHRRELRPQHLDRDLAVVLQVLGEIHRRHAALPQLPLDAVAVGEGGGERGRDRRHGWCKMLRRGWLRHGGNGWLSAIGGGRRAEGRRPFVACRLSPVASSPLSPPPYGRTIRLIHASP